MEKIVVSDLDKQLFEKEIDALKKASEICDSIRFDDGLKFNHLAEEYQALTAYYEKILRAAIKITNIGDKSQQKLYFALEKIKQQKNDIEERNRELYHLSISDHLTKIYNRTFVIEKLEDEFDKSIFSDSNLCCILFDLDHFKLINDNHGHLVGDFVLEKLARLIKSSISDAYYFGRYGGEEFLLVLPKTDKNKGLEVANHIRQKIEETHFIYNSLDINVTISCGVADNQAINVSNIDDLLNNADNAMYQAKKLGRNHSVIFEN